MDGKPTNEEIAGVLDRIAGLLEAQDASPFRIRAYRQGAERIRAADRSIAALVRSGDRQALIDMSEIGKGLAGVIEEYVREGRSSTLERLQGEVAPEDVFKQVPGIGEELAGRVANQLGIHTLEELEQAAHDGRLDQVEGFGPERVKAVRVGLAGMLSGAAQRHSRQVGSDQEATSRPSVETLLDVDAEYRRKAQAGELKKITPKRFNPKDEDWLPILHTERGDWSFTALYSNTARAHELGKTHDWVVIYYQREGPEDQATVVTETEGPLAGKRVIRGREKETRSYYESKK
jgi:Holliday junction resolvasome RuvABC DNA-binding subunit